MEQSQGLVQILIGTLQRLPEVVVQEVELKVRVPGGLVIDALLHVKIKGHQVRLLVEAKQSGYPRDIREAVHQISTAQSVLRDGSPSVSVVVAPLLSDTSREYLRHHQISYCEAGGSLYLETPWAFFSVEKPPSPRPARKARNLYRGSSAQVLHLLLARPTQDWRVGALAEEAHVSLSTVHQVFTALEQEGFMSRRGAGPGVVRRLVMPGKLLDAWANIYTLDDYEAHSFYRWGKSSHDLRDKVLEAFGQAGVEYALTLTSGAEFVAPFATAVDRLSIIAPSSALSSSVTSLAELEPVEEGANVTLFLASSRSPLFLRREMKGVWVASDIQLYLDLFASPARGKEQAAHLRRERIPF